MSVGSQVVNEIIDSQYIGWGGTQKIVTFWPAIYSSKTRTDTRPRKLKLIVAIINTIITLNKVIHIIIILVR